jgi:DNA-binding CsgD family transcriptional regulator
MGAQLDASAAKSRRPAAPDKGSVAATEALRLLARGRSKEIGPTLSISARTAGHHIARIHDKTTPRGGPAPRCVRPSTAGS